MKDQNHKLYTLKKDYDRYTIVMTQHIFSGEGRKRYGGISWIVYLDNEHIVLNTYIEKPGKTITEAYLDEHWNKFLMEYNSNIDVMDLMDSNHNSMKTFNKYDKKYTDIKYLTDIDLIRKEREEYKNKYNSLKRRINNNLKRAKEAIEELEQIK